MARAGLADPAAYPVRRTLPVAVADDETVTLAPLQLPLPEVAQALGVDVHWHTDVSYPRFAPPPRTAIPSKTLLPSPLEPFPDAVIRVSSIMFASLRHRTVGPRLPSEAVLNGQHPRCQLVADGLAA
jgi:hypothetical protein